MDSRAERVKEKLYPLVSRKNYDSSLVSEFSSTLLVPFAVLGTPTEGYQKSGTVRFAILVPFTTSDNGNRHNCVPYRTVLNRTARWKRAMKLLDLFLTIRHELAKYLDDKKRAFCCDDLFTASNTHVQKHLNTNR